MLPPYVDPDLSRAQTLPATSYFDPATFLVERERIFARTWQVVGRAEQVSTPGRYFTCSLAGEELLIVRGDDGNLRALSNVCRHRAGPVASGAGEQRVLQCRYHGWTYALDGSLLRAPEFEGVACFERGAFGLPSFRVESWGGFVFVNLDPQAAPLDEALGAIRSETEVLPLERLRLFHRHDYTVACNWKVYVDNYLEGYHIPIVHPGLFKQLDYRAYRVETARWHSKQHAPLRRNVADSLYLRHLAPGQEPLALYYWLYPNLMLNIYPDNVQINLILPIDAERTLTRFEWYLLEPQRPGLAEEFAASFAFSDEVQQEDIAICEAVQRGLRSRTYHAGRYSVARENGVHHFHRLVAEALGG
jgi:choline monooxygenase